MKLKNVYNNIFEVNLNLRAHMAIYFPNDCYRFVSLTLVSARFL